MTSELEHTVLELHHMNHFNRVLRRHASGNFSPPLFAHKRNWKLKCIVSAVRKCSSKNYSTVIEVKVEIFLGVGLNFECVFLLSLGLWNLSFCYMRTFLDVLHI